MSLHLIHGPPNSGRAGLIRKGMLTELDRDPVLVVPTADDVYAFERELCQEGAILGATVTNFGGLFRTVTAAAGAPPGIELTPAQRLGALAAAVAELRGRLGPLRSSARRPGFAHALAQLLDELQGAGLEPADVEAAAGTLEGSAYLGDVSALFAGYSRVTADLGRVDAHGVAREAIRLLGESGGFWRKRPVFIYGFDDLTRNQLDLIRALTRVADVTVALPYEEGNAALAARGDLLQSLGGIDVDSLTETKPDAGNTDSPLLFHLERSFGAAEAERMPPDGTLTVLRSAGERGEAEAIGAEVARLIAAGSEPGEIAIVVRDPGRRGPLLSSVLESYGIHTALDAEVGVETTSVGGTLIALLEAEFGAGRASNLLRYMCGPSGLSAQRVDWFERAVRRNRVQTAAAALALWEQRYGSSPEDLASLREAGQAPAQVATAAAAVAAAMAARVQRRVGGEELQTEAELEARAAGAVANALRERAELEGLAPEPRSLARSLAEMTVRAWTGPATGRVRIGGPDRLRAARFDHVFVASLQDGEFPRREGRADPFLSESQRLELGLPPRRDSEAEERYFFHASLALPRRRLTLSYRDSDENGAAEARSPFLEDVRNLLDPPPPGSGEDDPLEAGLTRGRDLAQVVHRLVNAPSERELARSIAAQGHGADAPMLLARAAAREESAARIGGWLTKAEAAEVATRAPGPLTNPTVLERLASVPAYGGTTLEGFDVCSYRWFVNHELRPERLEPTPDPLVQGGIMHAAVERLYREPPGAEPLPRPASLGAWIGRGRELVAEIAAERGLGEHPAERAILRRVEGLLARFLAEEAEREGRFQPWLLEAAFGEGEAERPVLEIDGWALHGAIDRVDRDADGRALVIDYKLASSVSALAKLEEDAKLQLQLYLIAVAELWGAPTVGGIYHPLRASSLRRPRGVVLDEAADALASYNVPRTDVVDREGFEELLLEARGRAGGIVSRMRSGDIRRDPGPRPGLRNHGICPQFCDLAPICRRDRAPVEAVEEEDER